MIRDPDANEPPVVVFRSLRARDCDEQSLVLTAMGIEHQVQRGWWGWSLVVAAGQGVAARQQLQLYEQENQRRTGTETSSQLRGGAKLGILAYASILFCLFILQGRHGFGIDWAQAGRLDSSAVLAGEWWRTITALTLHLDAGHLASNVGFGAMFAALFARQVGGGVAWLTILAGGTAGNAINALVQQPGHTAMGASTAVFAALGSLAVWLWVTRRLDQQNWSRRWTPIIGGLWLLAWLGTGDERTDVVAHLTGFAAGMGLGGLLAALPRQGSFATVAQISCGLTAIVTVAIAWRLAV